MTTLIAQVLAILLFAVSAALLLRALSTGGPSCRPAVP
jgi:hypothetical protein